jgi:predicted DNA-binding transcriptional regulator YafY
MNRIDCLVALVMMLQSRRVTTAAEMAAHFEITERTVYRDIAALGESGVPIVGEPGVGYSLMRGYHLPPVMFSAEEAFALITGGLLTERMTDGSMRESIRSAIGKVTAVLPDALQGRVDRLRKTVLVRGHSPAQGAVPLSVIQQALASARVLHLHYHGAARGEPTKRVVEPLGLVFYMDHWHLIAWCRLREDVRDFRVDRIIACDTLPEPIPPRRDFSLAEHLGRCMAPEGNDFAVIHLPAAAMDSVRKYWGPTIVQETKLGQNVSVRLAHRSGEWDYMAHWLLGHGTEATVVEPDGLRARVATLALAAAAHHQQSQSRTP